MDLSLHALGSCLIPAELFKMQQIAILLVLNLSEQNLRSKPSVPFISFSFAVPSGFE